MLEIFRAEGRSMRPTFDTRALLFVNTVSTVHKGDIVVVDVPDIGLIVK